MIIKSAKKKLNCSIEIPRIERKEYIKYLGIYIDEHLNWEQQLKVVRGKIAKNIGIICKLRYYVSVKTITDIYYSLIYPYLSYAVLSWGYNYKSKLEKICTMQNKCIRCIFFCNKFENATPLYNILGLLKFENILKLKTAILAFKIINLKDQIPEVFVDMLSLCSDQHQYNTRYSSRKNLIRPSVRTNYGKFTFQFSVADTWENIPTDIKEIPSLPSFKRRLKISFITSQTKS